MRHRDLLATISLLLLCSVVAAIQLFAYTGKVIQGFGPEAEWFTPAILWASGHGLRTPVPEGIPGLPEFMRGVADTVSLDAIPPAPQTWDLSPFCQTHRYLLYFVGVVWWLFGISWTTLKLVPLIEYVLSTALLYGIFRLGCGRRMAWVGTAFVMLSPPVLAMLPSVRDFGKMPFFFGIFLLLGLLMKGGGGTRKLPWIAAGLGALCGVGLGFRQDFMACMPACLAAILLLPDAATISWKHRVSAAAICVAALALSGWPILAAIERENGAVSSHSLTQGLSTEAEERLGFGGASYELLESTNDNLVHAVIQGYDRRSGGTAPLDQYLSPAYGDAGRRFFRAVALTFPYDLSARAFAAVRASFGILRNAPADLQRSPNFEGALIRALDGVYRAPAWVVSLLGLPCALAVALWLLAAKPRTGLALLALTLYFTGYTSILFQYRHAFHLAFVSPLFVALAATGLHQREAALAAIQAPGALRRGLLLGATTAMAAFASLGLLHLAQQARLSPLVAKYRSATLSPIGLTQEVKDGHVLLRVSEDVTGGATNPPRNQMDVSSAYVALRWRSLPSDAQVEVVYASENFGSDLSRTVSAPAVTQSGEAATLFFPIYETASAAPLPKDADVALYAERPFQRARFVGVRLREQDAASCEGLFHVEQADAFPFHLWLWLTPGNSGMRLHKRALESHGNAVKASTESKESTR